MKLGPVTKIDKKNKPASKKNKFDDVIAIFPICGQVGAIGKPDPGRIVCKTYISINL